MVLLPYRLALVALWLTGRRKKFLSAEAMMRAIARARARENADPPAAVRARVRIVEREVEGFRCMSVAPLGEPTRTRVLYVHGGSYVSQIDPAHWRLIADLVERTGCTVEVPVYGLAPEHTYREAFGLLRKLWTELALERDSSDLVLLGDSAGGGLALAFAQSMLGTPMAMPRDIALISPWLDLTLQNPEIARIQPLDPWLSCPGLIESGLRWAGGDERERFELSPIHGPLKGLGRVWIFAGTREIMIPDCRKLRDRGEADGTPIELIEGEGMIHVWPLLPIREAIGAIEKVASIIRGTAGSEAGIPVGL